MTVLNGIFVLFWASVVAWYAFTKGRSVPGFFILSLLITPIIAAIFVYYAEDLSKQKKLQQKIEFEKIAYKGAYKKCVKCLEEIRDTAEQCPFCGSYQPDRTGS